MSGLAILLGALALFAVLVLPCILLIKLAGTAVVAGGAVAQLHAQGGLISTSSSTHRAVSRALDAQRAAARA